VNADIVIVRIIVLGLRVKELSNYFLSERWSTRFHAAISNDDECVCQRANFSYQSRHGLPTCKRRGSLTHCCYERHLSNSSVPGKTSSNSASWRVKRSVSSLLRAAVSTMSSNRQTDRQSDIPEWCTLSAASNWASVWHRQTSCDIVAMSWFQTWCFS